MRERLGLAGPVLNSQPFGGYLAYRGVPTFFDGRIEMYGNEEWKPENVEFGIEDGVDLAPNPEMKIPAEAMKKLEEVAIV